MTNEKAKSNEPQRQFIKLDQLLKKEGVAGTGGHAKHLIKSGLVQVNGTVETRRGRKLITGDRVEVEGNLFNVSVTTPDLPKSQG